VIAAKVGRTFPAGGSWLIRAAPFVSAARDFESRVFATETLPGAKPGLAMASRAATLCVNFATLQEFSATTLMIDQFFCFVVLSTTKSKGVFCEITSREAFNRS
jgi:hypothetical protein